jgi:hypothetical protein
LDIYIYIYIYRANKKKGAGKETNNKTKRKKKIKILRENSLNPPPRASLSSANGRSTVPTPWVTVCSWLSSNQEGRGGQADPDSNNNEGQIVGVGGDPFSLVQFHHCLPGPVSSMCFFVAGRCGEGDTSCCCFFRREREADVEKYRETET